MRKPSEERWNRGPPEDGGTRIEEGIADEERVQEAQIEKSQLRQWTFSEGRASESVRERRNGDDLTTRAAGTGLATREGHQEWAKLVACSLIKQTGVAGRIAVGQGEAVPNTSPSSRATAVRIFASTVADERLKPS